MIKGLKVVMIVWSVIAILFGLGFVFAPGQLCSMFGFENPAPYVPYFLALLGIAYIVVGFFVIVAVRNPLKHIMWVQLAIAWSILDAVSALSYMIKGNVSFSQAGMVPILNGVLTVAFLIFYPWHKASAD
jgi:hypothetical protein